MIESMPNAESLIARTYELNERQQSLVEEIVNRVNESIHNISTFEHADDSEIQYVRLVVLSATRFYIDLFSRGHDEHMGELLVIPLPTDVETIFLLTRSVQTITRLLYVHITYNLTMNGVFTEYWTNIRPAVAFSVANGRDIFIHTELTLDNYQAALDESFEEAREHTIDQIYSTHHDHILHFSSETEVERTNDNTDCNLCYSSADYICEECKYPLCAECVRRIKTSNNTCPSCRHHPIVLRRIKDGNFTVESEPNDKEEDDVETNTPTTDIDNKSEVRGTDATGTDTEPEVRDDCIWSDDENDEDNDSDAVIDVIDRLQP